MTTESYLREVLKVGLGLSAIRIAALWFLLYREWSHHPSISLLPLILALYPEGLLLPAKLSWTVGRAVEFSGVLLLGSFAITTALFGAVRALKL